jgi:hypothetical protein
VRIVRTDGRNADVAQPIERRWLASQTTYLGSAFVGYPCDVASADRLSWPSVGHYVVALADLRLRRGVWHKKNREPGIVLHASIDKEPHWTKLGRHGWVGSTPLNRGDNGDGNVVD